MPRTQALLGHEAICSAFRFIRRQYEASPVDIYQQCRTMVESIVDVVCDGAGLMAFAGVC
jgi:hypothetical protein